MPDLHSIALSSCRGHLVAATVEVDALRTDAVGSGEQEALDLIDRDITSALARLREYEARAGLGGDGR